MMKNLLLSAALLFGASAAQAQILTPVKWAYAAKKTSPTEATLFLKATMDEGWHVYSQTVQKGGPVKTAITFAPAKGYTLVGTPAEPAPITKYEPAFEMPVSYFAGAVIFQQKVKLTGKGPLTIKGTVKYMTCNDTKCLPPDEVAFSIPVK
jgi:DsbC/DsbD-like thiol-disulfide interchange protein